MRRVVERRRKGRRPRDWEVLEEISEKMDNRKHPRLDKFDETCGQPLKDYLERFERYCKGSLKGDSCFWVTELELHLEGETLNAFKSMRKYDDNFGEIKGKLLDWYDHMKTLRKKKCRDEFNNMKYKSGESYYLFSSRLERSFRLAHPKDKVQTSSKLRTKFIKSVPKSLARAVSSQILSDRVMEVTTEWDVIQRIARFKDVEVVELKSEESDHEVNEREVVINIEREVPERVTERSERNWQGTGLNQRGR